MSHDVLVIGGGVAGLTAGVFTARAGLETVVVDRGESILERNTHLENVPGFPAGVNSRLFLDMLEEQARRNGCRLEKGEVRDLRRADDRFEVDVGEDGEALAAERVVAASWSDSSYLESLGVDLERRGSKQFVRADPDGSTDVEGLYAAGRLADQYHQAVVAAGHGAQTAITLVHDSDVPFYHDWVAPEGYFTGRGREVPPGCEEIDEAERERRERESMAVMTEYFSERHPAEPTQHPSVASDD